jgi:hypothetical protein
MKSTELCEEIRSYCRANADKAVVKKYSRYFKEGYDAYGVSREKYEETIVRYRQRAMARLAF